MRRFLISLALCLIAGRAGAQTPNASTLAAPLPAATPAASAPVSAILLCRDQSAGSAWSNRSLTVAVGDTVQFMMEPPGAAVPSTLNVLVNGKHVQVSSGGPLSFVADQAGIWQVQLDTTGLVSNLLTVIAR